MVDTMVEKSLVSSAGGRECVYVIYWFQNGVRINFQ